jgi:hypothetical protein
LDNDVRNRPTKLSEILLRTGTYPTVTDLFGVLDLGKLGFLEMCPTRILVGPREVVANDLSSILKDGTIKDVALREEVRIFLEGKNPWQR